MKDLAGKIQLIQQIYDEKQGMGKSSMECRLLPIDLLGC